MRTGLNEPILRRLYEDLGRTDSEIAEFFGADRTTIVNHRKRYGIKARKSTGEIGEEMVMKELRSRGFSVKNMNKVDKLHPFDLLLNDAVRIEVKSSKLKNDRFSFVFSEKPTNDNIESDTRIRLKSGRTRKLFRKTCDLMILVGIDDVKDCHFFILNPKDIPDQVGTIIVPYNPFSKSKYAKYRENWDLIENIKKTSCANN